MPQLRTQWDPTEWQAWVNQLLFARYGHSHYQRIPDKHGGDFGIEGFSSDGCVYQCYVVEEPVTTKERYQKQRDKVNEDLRKFVDNANELEKVFTGLKIHAWILVVPAFDSAKLVQYCGPKAEAVRASSLSYVSDVFAVRICTDEAWPSEAAKLMAAGASTLSLEVPKPPTAKAEEWIGANASEVSKLSRKVALLTDNETAAGRFTRASIRDYIKGQNAYEQLRTDFFEVHERVVGAKLAVEEQLEKDSTLGGAPARVTYREVEAKLLDRLREQAKLSPQLLDELTAEAMADWLIRCPLDFYEEEG